MPLPDERPRQSVANLIGRFEQQTKRQAQTPPAASRPSSVASQIVGDAAKEETKERREWPPKPKPIPPSVPSAPREEVKPNSPPPTSPPPISPPVPVADLKPEPVAVAPSATEEAITVEQAPPPPPVETAVPVPKPTPQRQPSIGTTAPARAPATPSKSIPARGAAATRVAARTTVRSPPSAFHGTVSVTTSTPSAHTTKPISTTKSTPAAAAKPRPSATTTRPSAPPTPARAKTPSIVRPKTPSSAVRPKTSASGLFAPTAASLAKARNTSSPAPATSTRKPTATAASLERLSKPTASSISKARAPTVSPPPTRVGKTPTRGTAPARGTAVKARGGPAAMAPVKKAAVAAAAATATAADDHVVEPEAEEEAPEGHQLEGSTSTLVDEPAHTPEFMEETEELGVHHSDEPAEGVEESSAVGGEEVHEAHEVITPVDDHVVEEMSHASEPEPLEHPDAVPNEAVHEILPDAPHHDPGHAETTSEEAGRSDDIHDHEDEHSGTVVAEDIHVNGKVDADIEDIVNLLESKPRPLSVAIIPDEVAEIPDEY